MENSFKLLVFALEGRKYALSLSAVERVIRSVEVTPLPKAPEVVSGIINVQGAIAPVFNLRKRFGLTEKGINAGDQMIIAKTARRIVALGVDGVEGVIEQPQGEIISAEKIHPEMEYVEGVIKLEGGMALIHDLGRFLSLDEKKALGSALKKARRKR